MDNPITARLLEGETVLWIGQPNKAQFIRSETPKIVWMFAVFAAYFLYLTIHYKAWGFLCFAVPCALYAVSAPFFTDQTSLGWADCYYAVTNKRILQTYEGETVPTFHALEFDKLRKVDLQERPDKTGTIICYSSDPFAGSHQRFTLVDNAREVYDLILSTQRSLIKTRLI